MGNSWIISQDKHACYVLFGTESSASCDSWDQAAYKLVGTWGEHQALVGWSETPQELNEKFIEEHGDNLFLPYAEYQGTKTRQIPEEVTSFLIMGEHCALTLFTGHYETGNSMTFYSLTNDDEEGKHCGFSLHHHWSEFQNMRSFRLDYCNFAIDWQNSDDHGYGDCKRNRQGGDDFAEVIHYDWRARSESGNASVELVYIGVFVVFAVSFAGATLLWYKKKSSNTYEKLLVSGEI